MLKSIVAVNIAHASHVTQADQGVWPLEASVTVAPGSRGRRKRVDRARQTLPFPSVGLVCLGAKTLKSQCPSIFTIKSHYTERFENYCLGRTCRAVAPIAAEKSRKALTLNAQGAALL
jgi:hypothetical protein